MPTNLVEHLVTFVENEGLDISKREDLVSYKGVESTGCAHNDVGEGVLVLQKLDILLNRSASIEDCSLDIW